MIHSRPAPRLLVVGGPTGTGKSTLALALAEALGGEIVGCDAVQVYRGFERGTAKPTAAERERVRHHLVDCVDPTIDHSLADHVRAAETAIADVAQRGQVPIVVGGTGLYLRGLLRGVIPAPGRDARLRERLVACAARHGTAPLRAYLARADPDSLARIAPSDLQRTVRAVELAHSGTSSWSERLRDSGTWGLATERYPTLKIGLDLDRRVLAAQLDRRVEGFFASGLVAEVRSLLAAGVPAEANAFKAIGYREVLGALSRGESPDQTLAAVQQSTRRYSKRQRTWFRKEPGIVWLDAACGTDALAERVIGLWRQRVILAASQPAEEGMESEARNLQNDFFNAARRERVIVTVFLGNGKRLTGRIKSFDKFTLLLEGHQGEQIVFKHAISTVSASPRGVEPTADELAGGTAPAEGRGRSGGAED